MPYIDKIFTLEKFGDRCFQLLSAKVRYQSRIKTGFPARINFVDYDGQGLFTIYAGKAYDGASNPIQVTAQTNAELALGLPHDIKFDFMRKGLIPFKGNFDIANDELEEDARAANMPHLIADAFHDAVQLFGAQFARENSSIIEVRLYE
jgi:hypothetical protein